MGGLYPCCPGSWMSKMAQGSAADICSTHQGLARYGTVRGAEWVDVMNAYSVEFRLPSLAQGESGSSNVV